MNHCTFSVDSYISSLVADPANKNRAQAAVADEQARLGIIDTNIISGMIRFELRRIKIVRVKLRLHSEAPAFAILSGRCCLVVFASANITPPLAPLLQSALDDLIRLQMEYLCRSIEHLADCASRFEHLSSASTVSARVASDNLWRPAPGRREPASPARASPAGRLDRPGPTKLTLRKLARDFQSYILSCRGMFVLFQIVLAIG
jgi:hypothetical protein